MCLGQTHTRDPRDQTDTNTLARTHRWPFLPPGPGMRTTIIRMVVLHWTILQVLDVYESDLP